MNACSRWIWTAAPAAPDQYAEFLDAFLYDGGETRLLISADSNYAVYVNGVLAASGQYADFPHYKIYDDISLDAFCREGENRLAVIVWYYGKATSGYFPGQAALRYELHQSGQITRFSAADTLSRLSPAYAHGMEKIITGQMGFSFRYDLDREDGWMTGGGEGFSHSRVVEQDLPMHPRPIARPVVGEPAGFTLSGGGTHWLSDLGCEEVGFLQLRIYSETEQDLLIAYGEHIVDGGVRRLIGTRDFSVEVRLHPGWNEYLNPFRRLGLRYLEAFSDSPVEVETLTVRPVFYPLARGDAPQMDAQQQRIYDVCVRTLTLCMHEHYEDTPWREQALYAMDSRNQMLCGYYAFREYAFARASLLLFANDRRDDELLSICSPSGSDLTIPSFSLHYFTAVREYVQHSGDLSLAEEVWPKLISILSAFTSRLEDGCMPIFTRMCHWNFYEWSEGLSGHLRGAESIRFDAALNCLLVLALRNMQKLADLLGKKDDYLTLADTITQSIRSRFFDAQRGLFVNSSEDSGVSELVNALAILCGAAEGETAAAIARRLSAPANGLTPASLSMMCFKYDALLKVDGAYGSWVLSDIAGKYQKMLDEGATSVWETELGQSDFDNAGSLCHGWSAMPVYYYHKLLSRG